MPYRKPVSVSLPPPLHAAVARRAKRQHQTTSELVREALRRYLEDRTIEETLWKDLRAYGAKGQRRSASRPRPMSSAS